MDMLARTKARVAKAGLLEALLWPVQRSAFRARCCHAAEVVAGGQRLAQLGDDNARELSQHLSCAAGRCAAAAEPHIVGARE